MSDDWRERVEADLAALDRQASTTLTDRHPVPEGLPQPGSWVRAIDVDDDARGTPVGPWHIASGWLPAVGRWVLRCGKASSALRMGLDGYLGAPLPQWLDRHPYTLAVQVKPPRGHRCKRCLQSVAGEEARSRRAAQAERDAAILALVPAIVNDPDLTDAQRGRRLRGLWASLERSEAG